MVSLWHLSHSEEPLCDTPFPRLPSTPQLLLLIRQLLHHLDHCPCAMAPAGAEIDEDDNKNPPALDEDDIALLKTYVSHLELANSLSSAEI